VAPASGLGVGGSGGVQYRMSKAWRDCQQRFRSRCLAQLLYARLQSKTLSPRAVTLVHDSCGQRVCREWREPGTYAHGLCAKCYMKHHGRRGMRLGGRCWAGGRRGRQEPPQNGAHCRPASRQLFKGSAATPCPRAFPTCLPSAGFSGGRAGPEISVGVREQHLMTALTWADCTVIAPR
jgi:hypothetical protein